MNNEWLEGCFEDPEEVTPHDVPEFVIPGLIEEEETDPPPPQVEESAKTGRAPSRLFNFSYSSF